MNRQVVVLNDTLRGRLWMPLQDTDLRVPDWTQIEPEEQPDEAQEETEASDTTQDLVTECSARVGAADRRRRRVRRAARPHDDPAR